MGKAIFKHPLHYRTCIRLPHSNSACRERLKDLNDSGAALSLANTGVYNMIGDHYKTKILPAAVHVKRADGSSMAPLGKATLHLHIANFKFSHTFIICDRLPETDILFVIDIQKRYSLSYSWDSDKQLFIQMEGLFLTYTRNCEHQHNIAVVKSTLKTQPRHNSIIPITIKRQNLKAPRGYFISKQHIKWGFDPNIHVIDGIYNIKGRSTLHVLVANYTNMSHLTKDSAYVI